MTMLTTQIATMVEDAIGRVSMGEQVEYDVSMTILPGQNNSPMPMVIITFAMRGMTLGEWHSGVVMLQPALPSQEQMDDLVRHATSQLVEQRTQATRQAMASANGHGQVGDPSGLILPGS